MKLMLRRSEWDNACTLGQRMHIIKKKQCWNNHHRSRIPGDL